MIEAIGVIKRFGPVEVLRGVDLTVARGEVAAIIGASGSGKSTLIRCLNGMESFQAGSVTVDGLRIDADMPAKAREASARAVCRRVGMVFQAFHLFPHRCVLENVTEGPIYVLGMKKSEAIDRAERLLDRVGLRDKLKARPRELSGGQQQRVAIARALAMDPLAILFDEPTSALDPRMTAEVLAVMADLARDGLTMVVVTHAMRFARKLATTVHVIADGRIAESGPPEQVLDDPRTESTRRLLAEVEAA
jgi:ABC-type polar amino acid transport system ATPase subunit